MIANDPHAFAARIERHFGARFEGLTTHPINATDSYPPNRTKYANPAFPHYAQALVKVEWTTRNAKTACVRRSALVPTWSWDKACELLEKNLAEHAKAISELEFEPVVAAILRHYAQTQSLPAIADAIRKAGAHDRGMVAYQDAEYAKTFAGEHPFFVNTSSIGPLVFRPDNGVQGLKDLQENISRRVDDVPSIILNFRKGIVNLKLWDGRMRWDTATRTVFLLGNLPEGVVDAAHSMIGKPLAQFVETPFSHGLKVVKVRTDDKGSCGAKIRLIYNKDKSSLLREKA